MTIKDHISGKAVEEPPVDPKKEEPKIVGAKGPEVVSVPVGVPVPPGTAPKPATPVTPPSPPVPPAPSHPVGATTTADLNKN